ncbi:MAG TPA: PIN domain-containing protein [Steroidobacteraceae bacterium]|nr:PIN domain-containing protein [Steroidobacteraceae bacterium]
MKAFFDTSVLVAAFYDEHEHHEPSFDLYSKQEKSSACTAAHCLAEVYAVVTGMPGKDRASPDEAMLFLQSVRERLSLVTLDELEYLKVLEDAASAGISGGTVYDAVIAHCALKSEAQTIYTWNTKHFNRLGGSIAARIKQP